MRRASGAVALLAGAGAVLALVAPGAGAATRAPASPVLFDVPSPSVPMRDVVLRTPSATASRSLATASGRRYPVNDGRGRSVEINVTDACRVTCSAANPQQLANFLGTTAHGDEMNILRIDVVTPSPGEMDVICGANVLACYFAAQDRIVLAGENEARGGLTQTFLLAHEYGHHLANHRLNPPFRPTIYYGTKRWASLERVCQGARQGRYTPGATDEDGYWTNPGEAFAESFAFARFPRSPVQWEWVESLRPNAAAFAAIRRDALRPWTRRARISVRDELRGGAGVAVHRVRTPLDGVLTLRLAGPRGSDFDLLLRDAAGRTLRSSERAGPNERLTFLVCGQARFRAVVKRDKGPGGEYRLIARRP